MSNPVPVEDKQMGSIHKNSMNMLKIKNKLQSSDLRSVFTDPRSSFTVL